MKIYIGTTTVFFAYLTFNHHEQHQLIYKSNLWKFFHKDCQNNRVNEIVRSLNVFTRITEKEVLVVSSNDNNSNGLKYTPGKTSVEV